MIAGAGKGVFAGVNIKIGESIETCEVIEILESELEAVNQTVIMNYIYYLSKAVLVLGNGSFYNHSYSPNAEFREVGERIEFVAIKNIKKDQEILVNYNPQNGSKYPMWFEV